MKTNEITPAVQSTDNQESRSNNFSPGLRFFMSKAKRHFFRTATILVLLGGSAAAQPSGSILVADMTHGLVRRYDTSTGVYLGVFSSGGGLTSPYGLTYGPDGNLFVSDFTSRNVIRYNGQNGAFLNVFTTAGGSPYDLTFGPDGNLYVGLSGGAIERFSGATGGSLGQFTPPYAEFGGMTFHNGFLFVTHVGASGQLRKYDATSGALVATVYSGFPGNGPRGPRFGPDGNLYVPVWQTPNVAKFDGSSLAYAGNIVSDSAHPFPMAVAFDSGSLFILDDTSASTADSINRYNLSSGAFEAQVVAPGSGGLGRAVAFLIIPSISAGTIPDQSGVVGAAFSFTYPETTFADSDTARTLSYAASGMPPGISFDGPSRTFSGTPTAAGNYAVTVTATDDGTPHVSNSIVFYIHVASAFAPPGSVTSFGFADFGTSTGLGLFNSAATVNGVLGLTPATAYQNGTAIFTAPVPLADGFDITFQFRISGPGGALDSAGLPGGDGLALIIQRQGPNATGPTVGYIPYSIPDALALEFDTWQNGNLADPDGNHLSLQDVGPTPVGYSEFDHSRSLGAATPGVDLSDGLPHTAHVRYRPGLLQVFLDGATSPTLAVAIDLTNVGSRNLLNTDGTAWLALAAGTGATYETHDIVSWSFQSLTPPPSSHAPVAIPLTVATAEETPVNFILSATDADLPPQALSFSIVTPTAHGTLSGTAPTLTYAPDLNYHGADSFTFKVNDGLLDSAPATVSFSVTPVIDTPVISSQHLTTPEDLPLAVALGASDVDGDSVALSVISAPAHGTVTGEVLNLTYTPAADFNGTDAFGFLADDGRGGRVSATIYITVTPVNDAPVATFSSVSTDEDTPVSFMLSATDADLPPQELTFAVVTPPTHGSLSGMPPNLTYTPESNYNGTDSFEYTVNDGQVTSAAALVGITVLPVNDRPSFTDAGNVFLAVNFNGSVPHWATAISAGPPDEQPQVLSFTVAGNSNPSLFAAGPTIAPDGTLSFTAASGVVGLAQITVLLHDNGGTASGGFDDSQPHSFNIRVNSPPVANPGGPYTINQGGSLALNGSGSYEPDAGDNILTSLWDLNSDGNYNDAAGATPTVSATQLDLLGLGVGTHTVRLRVFDQYGFTGNASTTLTIRAPNTAPLANAGGPYTINQGGNLYLDASASYDLDMAIGDSIVMYDWDLNNDGAFGDVSARFPAFTLTAAQIAARGLGVGTHTIRVLVTDSFGATSTASTTLTIRGTQTITFDAIADHTGGDAPFTINATSSSGLPVSFASLTPSVVAVSGNTVTIVGTGTATIRASQPGNAVYLPAANVDQTLNIVIAASAPVINSIAPAAAYANGPPFILAVHGEFFQAGSMVLWNGVARPTTFVSSTELQAAIPASDLATTEPLSTAWIAVQNPNGESSGVAAFSIVAQSVAALDTSVVVPGAVASASAAPTIAGESGVAATLQNNGGGSTILTTATYTNNPMGETRFKVSKGEFVDLQILGADSQDVATAWFYYPSTVTSNAEAKLKLQYFNGTNWVSVLSSGGVQPEKNITNNLDSTVSGGRFTVVFDSTSRPRITELSGTVFGLFDSTPQIEDVTGPIDPVPLGTTVTLAVSFATIGEATTPSITFVWEDGTESVAAPSAEGLASATHVYAVPGVYPVTVRVTDEDGDMAESRFDYVVVYDPTAGFVTGGGWIMSPPGAYTLDPTLTGKAKFGFESKYKKGATVPSGETEFEFSAGAFHFHSKTYQWLVLLGARAQFKGTGYIEGGPLCGFLLTATDGQLPLGGGTDKFRIRIWEQATGVMLYDNRMGVPEDINNADPQELGGGSITIKKAK